MKSEYFYDTVIILRKLFQDDVMQIDLSWWVLCLMGPFFQGRQFSLLCKAIHPAVCSMSVCLWLEYLILILQSLNLIFPLNNRNLTTVVVKLKVLSLLKPFMYNRRTISIVKLETDESFALRFFWRHFFFFFFQNKHPFWSVSYYQLTPRVNYKSHVVNFGSGGSC